MKLSAKSFQLKDLRKREVQYTLGGVCILIYVVIIGLRMYKWNNHLNSDERIITLATFYESHPSGGTKSVSNSFSYFYNVNGKYYFESVVVDYIDKSEVGNGDKVQFIAVVSKKDPTIHCIIWNKKLNIQQPIGKIFNYKIDKETIQYYTMQIGLSPRGRLDSEKEIRLRKINLLK
ncbi:hypothetical protein [Marinifilum fragile]|uniref:hypothetical protein n=1 Tax=Marinifilum fragile TaxID=570161 RepID=UPI002AAA8642|nr:hypothetical protein [Marinifilum fragile]